MMTTTLDELSTLLQETGKAHHQAFLATDGADPDWPLWDIMAEPKWRQELLEARGRGTVPVLRCESGGRVRWMPESRDIVSYLRGRFG